MTRARWFLTCLGLALIVTIFQNDLNLRYTADNVTCTPALANLFCGVRNITASRFAEMGARAAAELPFVRVHRHLHRFDQSKKFSTWIYTIASNLAKNELRNRSRSPLVLFQRLTSNWDDDHRPLQFEDVSSKPDDLYHKRHLRELVEWSVAQLPEHHRVVFVLRTSNPQYQV